MTEHIQEQGEVESIQLIDAAQGDENQPVELKEMGDETIVDFSAFSREEMVEHLSKLLDSNDIDAIRKDVDSITSQFYRKLNAERKLKLAEYIENGGVEEDFTSDDDELELALKTLLSKYREIRSLQNESFEAEKQKNLQEKLKIIEELKELAKSPESLSKTFQHFRDLQSRWRSIGLVPQNEVKNLWDTYHHFVELFYDYIKINKDLRDLDFKRNLEAKIDLCEQAESLMLESSVVEAFNKLQHFHEQWREIGPVPQEVRVEIWDRFKAISTQINKKH